MINSTGRHSCRETWSDDMKLQLLAHYIQGAENLEERDDKSKKYARKNTSKNLKPIYQKASIIVNGKSVRLNTIDFEHSRCWHLMSCFLSLVSSDNA